MLAPVSSLSRWARVVGLGLGLGLGSGVAASATASAADPTSTTSTTSTTSAAKVTEGARQEGPAKPGEVSASTPRVGGADNVSSKTAQTISLSPGHSSAVRFTPHGQYYVRGQGRFNSSFDPTAVDRESAVLQRVRFGLLAESGPLRAYIEVQDVRQWGFEERTISNQANVDLHQGYLELGGDKGDRAGYLRVGRQEIQIGSRRLFVDANWHPLGQSFDGIRAAGRVGRFAADAGFIVLDPAQTFSVADPGGDPLLDVEVRSRGTYSSYLQLSSVLGEAMTVEGLLLGVSERPSPNAPTGERDIVNAGLRLHGSPLRGLSYDVEAYGQAGRNLGLRHRAWASFSTVDYTLPKRLRPGLTLRYNYASGQACTGGPAEGCGNSQSGEFYRFFGLRHARYGIADRVGHSNLRDLEVGAHLQPHSSLRLDLGYHFLQLDKPTGRWRQANDGLVGVGWDPTNSSRNLAHEVDLLVTYRPWKQLFVQPGYGLFIPLEAGRRIAGPAPQHFVFLWMIGKF